MIPPIVDGVPMPSVQAHADAEAGKPCWILGGGPSLLKLDPRSVDGVVMAVNFSIWAHDRLGTPEAKYWLFGDTAMFWRPGHAVLNPDDFPKPRKFCAGSPVYYLLGKGYNPSEHGTGRTFIPYYNNEGFVIRRNSPYLWTQRSTLCSAVFLAWVLGCNPIHIRGADFGTDHGDGRVHWYDPPGPPATKLRDGEVDYERMKRPIRTLIAAIFAQDPNMHITAGGDPTILEATA